MPTASSSSRSAAASMTDYNGIDQDEPITGEGDINAVELRRARLGVEGVVFYDWKYKFEIDFAGDEVAIKDAYVAYANWIDSIELSEIRAGNQYVYTSLEQITSSRFITFMERAAFQEAFLPSVEADRQIGRSRVAGQRTLVIPNRLLRRISRRGQRYAWAGRVRRRQNVRVGAGHRGAPSTARSTASIRYSISAPATASVTLAP